MNSRIVRAALLTGIGWFLLLNSASAQVARPFDSPGRGRYAPIETSRTVSPYVNLTTGGGLSNYQTLVRPLIEEREELNRQWSALDELNRQVRGTPLPNSRGQNRAGANTRGASGVRYMHYSHYFGTNR